MSGHIDHEAGEAWTRAKARAAERGMKPVWMEAGPVEPGKKRWFRFMFEPMERPRKAKPAKAPAPPVASHKVTRGVAVRTDQGTLL